MTKPIQNITINTTEDIIIIVVVLLLLFGAEAGAGVSAPQLCLHAFSPLKLPVEFNTHLFKIQL